MGLCFISSVSLRVIGGNVNIKPVAFRIVSGRHIKYRCVSLVPLALENLVTFNRENNHCAPKCTVSVVHPRFFNWPHFQSQNNFEGKNNFEVDESRSHLYTDY